MKIYFKQENSGNCEELIFSSKYKQCVINISTFIRKPHKRLNRLKYMLRSQDKLIFILDIWDENDGPEEKVLGKAIEVTSELIKFLVSVININIEHGFYTLEHKELIKEWKQRYVEKGFS